MPKKASKWSSGNLNRWNRPFVVNSNHAEWGASAAKESGSTARTIGLIRRHQECILEPRSEDDELLLLLQWADDIN
jgi:hypothetical protein